MRPEYDFSEANRGVTARRYSEGAAVNEVLQALAPLFRHR